MRPPHRSRSERRPGKARRRARRAAPSQRHPAAETGVQLVPERNLLLAPAPAQKYDPALPAGVEVDQPVLQVLGQATALLDLPHRFFESLDRGLVLTRPA